MGRAPSFKFEAKDVFTIYDLYARGETDSSVASMLGMPERTYVDRKMRNPAVKSAAKYGRRKYKEQKELRNEFEDMVIGRLPTDLQEVWKKIKHEAKHRGDVRQPTQHMNMRAKQVLYLHAWVKSSFSSTKAAKFLGIPYATILRWKEDKDFEKLRGAMLELRKDFIEDGLMRLVRVGNHAATIFAAKSLLKDRGYGDETKVVGKIEHQHDHTVHAQIDLTELDLPVDVQMMVMEAIEKRHKKISTDDTKVIEYVPNQL